MRREIQSVTVGGFAACRRQPRQVPLHGEGKLSYDGFTLKGYIEEDLENQITVNFTRRVELL
jgi:hypothetical protein